MKEDPVKVVAYIFFSTIAAYNFHRLKGISSLKVSNKRIDWVKLNMKFSHFLTIFSFLLAVSIYFLLPNSSIIIILPLSLICLWYVISLLKYRKFNKPLREIPFLKIFLIAFVWAGACFMFPLVSNRGFSVVSDINIQLMCVAFALYVFSQTLPFDIRDLKDDLKIDLLTIPAHFGIRKTKFLSSLGFSVSALIFLYVYLKNYISILSLIAFSTACLLSILMVLISTPRRSDFFYSFLMEACLILPYILYKIFHFILHFQY